MFNHNSCCLPRAHGAATATACPLPRAVAQEPCIYESYILIDPKAKNINL